MIINKEFDSEDFRIKCSKFDMKMYTKAKKMRKKLKTLLTRKEI